MDGTLRVEGGLVRGHEMNGVWAFLGVPYARAPVGPLRWRPPAPPEPWIGVRDAVVPGPLAPQAPAAPGSVLPGDPLAQSEDCLHLSVWTPALDDGRRPVMVWVHGGAFTSGSAGNVLYRGDALAGRCDVVVVSVNYRLGALGFLAHPALATEDHDGFGNWGLLDQIAALRWVRDHVAAFGGDPENVTVFGESAGAMSIASLLAMPDARGLCRRVVIQSGPPYVHSAARAEAAADALAATLGLESPERAALEELPAGALVDALSSMQGTTVLPGELPLPLLPAVDGRTLPATPLDAIRDGAAEGVDVLVGTNRDEVAFFGLADPAMATLDDDGLRRRLVHSAPACSPDHVAAAYRAARSRRGEAVTPRDLWIAAASDLVFRWPSLRLAAAVGAAGGRAYVYLFTWESPVFGGALGACHGLEIPFVFGTVREPAVAAFTGSGARALELSGEMQAAWAAFARRGDPSTPGTGSWPVWEPTRRATMVLGPAVGVEDAPRSEELASWETLFPLDDVGRRAR